MSNDGIFDSDVWTSAKVQIIRTSQRVWWMPGATHCSFLIIGGGGGGGGGRYSTTGNAGGGSGGSGAQLNYCRRFPRFLFQASQMINEYFNVTIGAGGLGGASSDIDNGASTNGGSGGQSKVEVYFNAREGASQGQNVGELSAWGGGLGTGGSGTVNVNANATSSGFGALNGETGGSGSLTGGGNVATNHSGNSFGTNPFLGSMIPGGNGGNSKATLSQPINRAPAKFYQNGASTPTMTAGTAGRDGFEKGANIWNYVEQGHFKEAPYLEDLWWFTGTSAAGGGVGGSTTNRGGRGGTGYFGSGGGGGAGSGNTGSGQGGDGGTGVAVFWWEKLQ